MKIWKLINAVLFVGILCLTANCSKHREETYVIKAVKNYRVAGQRMENLIELQTKALKKKDKSLKLSWSEAEMDEGRFKLVATLKAENSKKATKRYVFQLRKNYQRTEETGVNVWRLLPRSNSARELMSLSFSQVKDIQKQASY